MDERTVPASQIFDAQTLKNIRAIQETLSKIDLPVLRIDPEVLAGVQTNIVTPEQVAAMADAVAQAGQFDGVLRAMQVAHLPAIVEQISAALLVASKQWTFGVVRSVAPPTTVDVDLLGDTVSDELEDDELDTAEVEEQLERILELPDYQAEQLAISLGLALDKVPARVGVVLVMSIMVVIQIVHPKLFDSLMEGKRNWTELFQGAAHYWD